jgi:hypothetical protein
VLRAVPSAGEARGEESPMLIAKSHPRDGFFAPARCANVRALPHGGSQGKS